MLLDRLRADCDYFLGAGGRSEKHLWAGSVYAQIKKMRELYDALSEKPEWLTAEAIDRYAAQMAAPYQIAAYHHFENGFDDKLDYQTLEEAEAAAQGYVAGTMEEDGFVYPHTSEEHQKFIKSCFGEYSGSGRAGYQSTAAKKENARAPSENSSKERGTGARASTEPATEKADARPSVRSRLMALQAAAERDGTAPTKDTVRETIQKAMPTQE